MNLLRAQHITTPAQLRRAYGDYLRDYPQAAYITEAALGGQSPAQIMGDARREIEDLDQLMDAIASENIDDWDNLDGIDSVEVVDEREEEDQW